MLRKLLSFGSKILTSKNIYQPLCQNPHDLMLTFDWLVLLAFLIFKVFPANRNSFGSFSTSLHISINKLAVKSQTSLCLIVQIFLSYCTQDFEYPFLSCILMECQFIPIRISNKYSPRTMLTTIVPLITDYDARLLFSFYYLLFILLLTFDKRQNVFKSSVSNFFIFFYFCLFNVVY